ncbi:NAD(+)/NADH kinase [Halobellus ruber]|uniref:NAD(+)/NADH kinase n=1 Tax=Halobellus ruber TaxID=2761102 RepID=UPI0031B5892A
MSEVPVVVVAEGRPLADALAGTDARVERVAPDAVVPDALDGARIAFAVGEPALLAVARHRPETPIAPVAAGVGRYDLAERAAGAVVEAAGDGDLRTVAHPLFDVAVAGERAGSAVADVTLLTAEPARISEFGIGSTDGWFETVRADGVVVATPLGSTGYARDAGAPVIAPGTGLVAVPVSAYAMHAHPWVLRPPMSLSVERDEADVTLRLDDEEVRSVPPDAPVDVGTNGSLSLVAARQFSTD